MAQDEGAFENDFTSADVRSYLKEPFVFTQPGVEAREITLWTEGGQTWRRLDQLIKHPSAYHR